RSSSLHAPTPPRDPPPSPTRRPSDPPIHGENIFTPLMCSQTAPPALNGIHLSMSAWPNQPLGGPGRNPLRVHTTNSSAIAAGWGDRKSTPLDSSHRPISYARFCLQKK